MPPELLCVRSILNSSVRRLNDAQPNAKLAAGPSLTLVGAYVRILLDYRCAC